MDNCRERLLAAAIEGVRIYGLEGVRIQHIGKLAGCVTSNIYSHFPGKDDLMRACFEWVDRQIAGVFEKISLDEDSLSKDPAGEVRRFWTPYFRWLVAHPNETVFYHRYRDSPGFPAFDKTRDVSYFAAFVCAVKTFFAKYHIRAGVAADIFWLHMLTGTVLYAKYVVEGVLPNTRETEEMIFQLEVSGLSGLFGT